MDNQKTKDSGETVKKTLSGCIKVLVYGHQIISVGCLLGIAVIAACGGQGIGASK